MLWQLLPWPYGCGRPSIRTSSVPVDKMSISCSRCLSPGSHIPQLRFDFSSLPPSFKGLKPLAQHKLVPHRWAHLLHFYVYPPPQGKRFPPQPKGQPLQKAVAGQCTGPAPGRPWAEAHGQPKDPTGAGAWRQAPGRVGRAHHRFRCARALSGAAYKPLCSSCGTLRYAGGRGGDANVFVSGGWGGVWGVIQREHESM